MDKGQEQPGHPEIADEPAMTLDCRLSLEGELAIQTIQAKLRAKRPDTALEYALGTWTSLVRRADTYDQIGFCGAQGFQRLRPVPMQPQPTNSRDSAELESSTMSVRARIYAEFEEAAILHGLSIDRAIEAALAVTEITIDKIRQRQRIGYTASGQFFELS